MNFKYFSEFGQKMPIFGKKITNFGKKLPILVFMLFFSSSLKSYFENMISYFVLNLHFKNTVSYFKLKS